MFHNKQEEKMYNLKIRMQICTYIFTEGNSCPNTWAVLDLCLWCVWQRKCITMNVAIKLWTMWSQGINWGVIFYPLPQLQLTVVELSLQLHFLYHCSIDRQCFFPLSYIYCHSMEHPECILATQWPECPQLATHPQFVNNRKWTLQSRKYTMICVHISAMGQVGQHFTFLITKYWCFSESLLQRVGGSMKANVLRFLGCTVAGQIALLI